MLRNRYIYIGLTTAFILAAAVTSFWLYRSGSEIDLISFTISLVSLTISLMAFLISLNTFMSIDSVNKITKMDGNILENEDYVTSLGELMKQYDGKTVEETERAIFDSLNTRLTKHSKTTLEFTETLQHFIDILVFFPALFHSSSANTASYERQMAEILRLMDKKRRELTAINNGNRILVHETVKLIEGVIAYQRFVMNGQKEADSLLLEVRGTLLKNAVTRTVYYNYLGLMYNKKAMAIIHRELSLTDKDLLTIEHATVVRKQGQSIPGPAREQALMFLRHARHAFKKALQSSREDTMWLGYITYNDARTCFFQECLTGERQEERWDSILVRSIDARSTLNTLIEEILGAKRDDTHLQKHYRYQEEMARLVMVNLSIAERAGTDSSRSVIYRGIELTDDARSPLPFYTDHDYKRLSAFQADIEANRERLSDR